MRCQETSSIRPTVLVVDDEPMVLATVSVILARAGFEVLRAGSPSQALEIALAHSGRIDLLVSDVLMPGMSGPTLADRIAGIHPEAESLFIAGYAQHPEVLERIVGLGRAFLAKPFLPRDLVAKVRELLAHEKVSAAAG